MKRFTPADEPITLLDIANRAKVSKCKADYHYRNNRFVFPYREWNGKTTELRFRHECANRVLKAIECANQGSV